MKTLIIIPARGGSKGIPGKNIKNLNGKPLIYYSIEIARSLVDDIDICVSTDDLKIKNVVEETGLNVPFLRPLELANDNSSTNDVILHALEFYKTKGVKYECVILLQPTSPLRQKWHVEGAIDLFSLDLDMVVSVKETSANPYYVLFEEDKNGYLYKSKDGNFVSRQECPKVYEYNGAVYIINVKSLYEKPIVKFNKIKKYLMRDEYSIDIDNQLDWMFTDFLINKNATN
jgi:CMP-N,N'-diacetyllegionaminic acid synthase